METSSPSSSGSTASPVRSVSGWRYALLWPVALLVRLWARTLRIRATPEVEQWLRHDNRPGVIIFWHNRIFVSAELHRRYRRHRPISGLVSASNDGAWLAAFFRLAGIHSVRGSSSRRTLTAARELLKVLGQGSDIAVTPDGPRGPCYDFKAGAALMAKKAEAPVVVIAPVFSKAWRLRSWDGFYLPKPFSRVEVGGEIIRLEAEGLSGLKLQELADALRERLDRHTVDI